MRLPPCTQSDIRKPCAQEIPKHPRASANPKDDKVEVVSSWITEAPVYRREPVRASVKSKAVRELSKMELAEKAWSESLKMNSGNTDQAIKEFIAKHFGGK